MTEDEAKTKWCPFARVAKLVRDIETGEPTGVVSSGNRFLSDDGAEAPSGSVMTAHCIGPSCMAWRWARIANPDWKPTSQMAVFPQPNPYSDANPQAVSSTTDGYCGLAGSPR